MSMSIKKFATKKVVVIGAAVALTLGIAGGAFAYFTASGTGTGSASTGSSTAMTLWQDTALNAVAPGVTAQTIYGHQYNSAGTPEFVAGVTPSVTSVTETATAIADWGNPVGATSGLDGTYYCSASDYTLTPSTVNAEEASGANASTSPTVAASDFSFGTIAFHDTASNQDACEGATLVLGFTSN